MISMDNKVSGNMALIVNILVTATIYAVIKKDVPRDVVINNDQEEEDINFDDIKIS